MRAPRVAGLTTLPLGGIRHTERHAVVHVVRKGGKTATIPFSPAIMASAAYG
ncbi:MAG: hypothetical protein ACRDP8_23045 [Actinopolymorphaceae bacterium]